jgi:hypothetical protein
MKIKFEALKRRAAEEYAQRVGLQNCMAGATYHALLAACTMQPPRKPRELLAEWMDEGLRLIAAWDVRCCMKLVELFPSCLPTHLHKRRPVLGYDEKGEWALFFA